MSGIVGSRLNIRGSGLVGSLGTDGQVFTSAGAGLGAVYEDAAAGGKFLQVQHTNYNSSATIANTSYVSTGLTCAITPSATDSKILGLFKLQASDESYVADSYAWGWSCRVTRSGGASGNIFEDGTGGFSNYFTTNNSQTSNHVAWSSSYQFLDTSHSTTSAITYTAWARTLNANEGVIFQNSHPSQMTLMEISA